MTRFKIQLMDKIDPKGLVGFPKDRFEVGAEIKNPDALIVRSKNLHEMEFPTSLLAIGRAGAGVNNIPQDRCREQGILIFNTPGANANGVKELVLMGLVMMARNIFEGIQWTHSLKGRGDEVAKLVEKEKSRFTGNEVQGKRLGVIGLGAIGVTVANDAEALGMEVFGYDPFLSVEHALGLSRRIQRAETLDSLLAEADYLTLHIPLNDKTRNLLGPAQFERMKQGMRILNFARGGLVDEEALAAALEAGKVAGYLTDFPNARLLDMPRVLCVPHLGASTPEASLNCASMATNQLKDFLEHGNVKNSVLLPDCHMQRTCANRIALSNRNVPNMIGQMTAVLAGQGVNISAMMNKSQGDFAYNLIGIDSPVEEQTLEKLRGIPGVIRARLLDPPSC